MNLVLDLENRNYLFKNKDLICISSKTEFVKLKREINRYTLYSFDGPFQLLYSDVANLEILRKSAGEFKYCLLAVDLFTSKVYTYPMKSRRFIAKNMNKFYEEVDEKRKGKNVFTDRSRISTE